MLKPKFYNDFSYGMADKKYLARGDFNIRDKAFLESENVIPSNSSSLIPRQGTKLIKDFGEFANIKCVPFSRGDNQKYMLVFKDGEQQIYFVDDNGFLVESKIDDVESDLVPKDLTSNTDQDFNIVSTDEREDAYKIFSNVGITDTNVHTVDITFPTPITFFRLNIEDSDCAVLQATIYKSTGESFSVNAMTESFNYSCTSCGGASCRNYIFRGYTNKSSYTFELPATENTYDDIKRIVFIAKKYVSETTGSFPISYTSCWKQENGFFRKLNIVGTNTTGGGAIWNYDIPVDVIKKANFSMTNRYIFFANKQIEPYSVSIFGSFSFSPINAEFPTTGEIYNFDTMGYPNVVCAGQSRLWYAGFEREPTSIIGSQVGYNLEQLANFNPTFDADAAYMPSSPVKFQPIDIRNAIQWVVASDTVNFGSWDGIYKMTYGQGQPVSATGAVVLKQNEDTTNGTIPAWYNGAMVFATISGDELRLLNYNLIVNRQESIVISKFHNDLNAKGIDKLLFIKNSHNYIYVLYKDGTGAICKIYSNEVQGFYPITIMDGIEDIVAVKTNRGERVYFVAKNGNNTSLLLSDLMDYPKYPADINIAQTNNMQLISEWVYERTTMDAKVYLENKVFLESGIELEIGKLQTESPANVDNLTDSFQIWCPVNNFGVENVDDLVEKTIIATDDRGSNYTFKITIKALPFTDGTTGLFYFGVPYEGTENDESWNIEITGDVLFSSNEYNIGIESVQMDYVQNIEVFSNEKRLGTFCPNGNCQDSDLTGGIDPLTGKAFFLTGLPVEKLAYGRPYRRSFTIGYIQNIVGYARRKISSVDINSFASWALQAGVYNYDLNNSESDDIIKMQTVGRYSNNGNVFGFVPTPLKSFERITFADNYSTDKAFIVSSDQSYPFEIFNITIMLEENDTAKGV